VARFVLSPCKLRESRLVAQKGESPVTLNWPELCKLLAPSRDPQAFQVLQLLRAQAFVGLTKHPRGNGVTNFVLLNADRSGDLKQILKRDPTFGDRLESVYRVEEARWDASVKEASGLSSRPQVIS
jgi:hypothetical protein